MECQYMLNMWQGIRGSKMARATCVCDVKEGYVNINGEFYPFEEIQADINAAIVNGLSGKWAFTPATVQGLLDALKLFVEE